jgi:hypothetical protein
VDSSSPNSLTFVMLPRTLTNCEICLFSTCYNSSACAEGTALLESNRSADTSLVTGQRPITALLFQSLPCHQQQSDKLIVLACKRRLSESRLAPVSDSPMTDGGVPGCKRSGIGQVLDGLLAGSCNLSNTRLRT